MARKLLSLYKPQGSHLLSAFVTGLKENFDAIEAAFPVGYIWISTSETSPANVVGGQWKPIGAGRVLVACATQDNFNWYGDEMNTEPLTKPKQVGGQARHTHLTPMGFDGVNVYGLFPSPTNKVPAYNSVQKDHQAGVVSAVGESFTDRTIRYAYTRENSNYPPYYTVYMWERTS